MGLLLAIELVDSVHRIVRRRSSRSTVMKVEFDM